MGKISSYTEDTAPTGDDNVVLVDDIAGSPATKRAALQNLGNAIGGYGSVYTASGTGSQTLTSATKLTQWATDGPSSDAVTPSQASDKLTLHRTGRWLLGYTVSYEGSGGVTGTFELHVGGTPKPGTQSSVTVGSPVRTVTAAATSIVAATAGDDVELFATNSSSGDVDLKAGQLWAVYLGTL